MLAFRGGADTAGDASEQFAISVITDRVEYRQHGDRPPFINAVSQKWCCRNVAIILQILPILINSVTAARKPNVEQNTCPITLLSHVALLHVQPSEMKKKENQKNGYD